MRFRTTMAAVTTGMLVLGGTAACSSTPTPPPESPTASPSPSVAATPNGVEQLTADQILERTREAAGSAQSVKVAARTEQGTESVSFDLTLTTGGAQGNVSNVQGSLELIATADTIYIKGDDRFNQSFGGESGAALLQGKWLSIPADNAQAEPFRALSSLDTFFEDLLSPESTPTTVPPKDINGTQAVGLKTDSGTLWVATTGEPYPVAIEPTPPEQGSVTMTDWNASVTITPPPADQIVDITNFRPSGAPSPTAS